MSKKTIKDAIKHWVTCKYGRGEASDPSWNIDSLAEHLANSKPNLRDWLIEVHLDYTNNYLSVDLFAEHNGVDKATAVIIRGLAREAFEKPHPEA